MLKSNDEITCKLITRIFVDEFTLQMNKLLHKISMWIVLVSIILLNNIWEIILQCQIKNINHINYKLINLIKKHQDNNNKIKRVSFKWLMWVTMLSIISFVYDKRCHVIHHWVESFCNFACFIYFKCLLCLLNKLFYN